MESQNELTYSRLTAFFLPLGFSASLTAITHMIINGTLSRGEDAAFIIACYAVALALFGIVERPVIVFRQTASALIKDQRSFQKLNRFMWITISVIILASYAFSLSPVEAWVYMTFFNADQEMVATISFTFKVIVLVVIFSGIRGIFQGLMINRLQTGWLTIMVIIRLMIMFVAAYLFIFFDAITSMTGAIIFLIGMLIECVMSVWKGGKLLKKDYDIDGDPLDNKEISQFYFPLVFYFLLQTLLIPIIYVFLSQTENIQISIAAFALAFSITQMLLSFFMYTHQLVLQLYKENKAKVIRFFVPVSLIPALCLIVLCYTPAGDWFMMSVMGADPELAASTLLVLQFFIIKTLVFPWVDFLNGYLMIYRKTRRMLAAQIMNIGIAILSISLLVSFFPAFNGVSGAIAVSLGELTALIVVLWIVRQVSIKNRLLEKIQSS